MNSIIDWFARNRVAANLLMIIIMAGGLMSILGVKKEIFPEMEIDIITVSVLYPGASPDEVEGLICIKIEDKIQDIQGIKKVRSTAGENFGSVIIEFDRGFDLQEKLDEVKMRVDSIDFPEYVEEPIVQRLDVGLQVINVAVMSDAGEKVLKRTAEDVRDEISEIPGITQVSVSGVRPYEISIEVPEENLRKYGLTFDQVVSALKRSSFDLPGGSLKTTEGEILIRTKAQKYTGAEFEKVPIIPRPDGTYLTLGEIAAVIDGFEETDVASKINGKKAAVVLVYRVGEQNALTVAEKVKDYVKEKQAELPEGIELVEFLDMSEFLKSRLDLLERNGILGFILVFIILTIFIRLRLAFWVSLGIPISFLGALWLMPGLDISINMISLFAFILVLGIVVDDAIIVGENIHSTQQRTGKALEGAIKGAQEVSTPVIFAVLTTMAAFFPLMTFSGPIGKFIFVVPIIVIFTLAFSLVESLIILPAHLSHIPSRKKSFMNPWGIFDWLGGKLGGGFWWFVNNVYGRILESSIRRRYLTVACFMAILIFSIGLVGGGIVKFVFFPDIDSEYIVVNLTMPEGTPLEETGKALEKIENAAVKLNEEFKAKNNKDLIVFTQVLIGGKIEMTAHTGTSAQSASNIGMVLVQLLNSEERALSSETIGEKWRKTAGPIPGALQVEFKTSMRSAGKPIEFQLSGKDLDKIRKAAEEVKERLAAYEGVYDITDSFREGKEEIATSIKPEGAMLGLTNFDLRQMRQTYYGEEVQRVQRGRDDIPVMVRSPKPERTSLKSLDEMHVRTPGGLEIPFRGVAQAYIGRAYSTITRTDQKRTINVSADIDIAVANANEVVNEFQKKDMPKVMANHPGISWDLAGEQSEQAEALGQVWKGVVLALLAIYFLMAVPFKSYLQPAIVMSAIPFGFIGAVFGHLALDYEISILSVFGLIALAGVVVNDSLVLVHRINSKRRNGIPLAEAIREAGIARFRPIILTSLTTFFGLMPMMFETSFQAKILIPMAISLAFGVLFSTFITLILIPVEYMILEDIKLVFRRIFIDE